MSAQVSGAYGDATVFDDAYFATASHREPPAFLQQAMHPICARRGFRRRERKTARHQHHRR